MDEHSANATCVLTESTSVSMTGSVSSAGTNRSRIHQDTASRIYSMKALGDHRAMKAEEAKNKDDNKQAEKEEVIPPKSLEECLKRVTPLLATSHLLAPTQATHHGAYRTYKEKEDTTKEHKPVKPLPSTSHLLAATTASKHYVYHPPPPPKPIVRPGSPEYDVSNRLTNLTACRKAAKYEKKVIETDPREQGWVSQVTSSVHLEEATEGTSPRRSSTPTSRVYRDVKSKLLTPTAASKHGQWAAASPSSPVRAGQDVVTPQRSTSRGPHSNVQSRLYRPTTASQSGRYQPGGTDTVSTKQTPSPTRSSTPNSQTRRSASPIVSEKTTAAQRGAQRSKYVAPQDEADVARARPSSASSIRRKVPKDSNCVLSEELCLDKESMSALTAQAMTSADQGGGSTGVLDLSGGDEVNFLKGVIMELQHELGGAREIIASQAHQIRQCEIALHQSDASVNAMSGLLQTHYRLVADKSSQLSECEIALHETTALLQMHNSMIGNAPSLDLVME